MAQGRIDQSTRGYLFMVYGLILQLIATCVSLGGEPGEEYRVYQVKPALEYATRLLITLPAHERSLPNGPAYLIREYIQESEETEKDGFAQVHSGMSVYNCHRTSPGNRFEFGRRALERVVAHTSLAIDSLRGTILRC